MSIEFKRPKASNATIELTPLIDIIFQLLIFFMITSSVSQSSLDITLPRLTSENTLAEAPHLILSIFNDGSLKLNGALIQEASLKDKLEFAEKQSSLYLEADEAVPYDKILKILKKIREAGIESVNFLHEVE